MTEVKKFTKNGKPRGTAELSEAVFGTAVRDHVVHTVVMGQLRNQRQGNADTKERGETAFSTRKPWRQKGTGRARAGGRNSPVWRGGGTVFGPHPRAWQRPIPRKLRRSAVKAILLDRAAAERLLVVEGVPWSKPETKTAAGWLKTLGATGRTLVVTAEPDRNGYLSLRNIPDAVHTFVGQLSATDLAAATTVILTTDALAKLEEVLA